MNKVYENIKKYRIKKGLSQSELAKLTGYTDRSSIAKIESGVVDLQIDKVSLFAKVLGVEPYVLMGWEDAHEENAGDVLADVFNDKELLANVEKLSKLPEVDKAYVYLLIETLTKKNEGGN